MGSAESQTHGGQEGMAQGKVRRTPVWLRGTVAFTLGGAIPAVVSAQQPAPAAAAAALVFDGVTVVDVEQGKVVPAQRVVITGNRIAAVGSANAVKTPPGAQVVEAKGKYLIPGLWDMHTHFGLGNSHEVPPAYRLLIANGVTGFRDAGGSWVPLDSMMQWRREILAGSRVGPPRQLFSVLLINDSIATEAIGSRKCRRHEQNPPGRDACVNNAAEAQRLIDSLKAAGADMIKTYMLSKDMYFAVAAAARRAGLLFGGHAPNVSPFDAADSGASIIDHVAPQNAGVLDSLCFAPGKATVKGCRAVAERFRQTNTWSVPTLGMAQREGIVRWFGSSQIISNLMVKTVQDFWTDFKYNPTWLHTHEPMPLPATPDTLHFGYLKIPMQVGLPILSGGDTGPREAGFKTHADMAIMVDQGLTPLAALQAATLNPAKMLRATDSLGTVAKGKLADLVLLDANPLADITNTTLIRAVVANGRYFDRVALDTVLAQVQARAKQKQ